MVEPLDIADYYREGKKKRERLFEQGKVQVLHHAGKMAQGSEKAGNESQCEEGGHQGQPDRGFLLLGPSRGGDHMVRAAEARRQEAIKELVDFKVYVVGLIDK